MRLTDKRIKRLDVGCAIDYEKVLRKAAELRICVYRANQLTGKRANGLTGSRANGLTGQTD
jgi:uncharacterized LabA/DUF88 family protein